MFCLFFQEHPQKTPQLYIAKAVRLVQIFPSYHCSKLESDSTAPPLPTNPGTAHTTHTHTDTHCQLIQRGDQSQAPVQHTLRGRVVKQSTVCIICTAAASHFSVFFFFISLSHLSLPSARLVISRHLPWWLEIFFSFSS